MAELVIKDILSAFDKLDSSESIPPMYCELTVQLSRFQRDSPDNEAHVPSSASPKVGTIDVPTSALYLQFTFSALRTLS